MASSTNTARVTGETWVDLDVTGTHMTFRNTGQKTIALVVDSSAPSDDAYLEDAILLKPCDESMPLIIESGDNVYARVYSSHETAKSTISWHQSTPA